ncbi:MAG: biotin/lipoyl-containing protein [bacterium]
MKKFNFSVEGNKFDVTVTELDNNIVDVVVNGSHYTVEIDREATRASNVQSIAPKKSPARVSSPTAPVAPQAAAPQAAAKATTVCSQLPGSIISIVAGEGTAVKRGDVVIVIESMKMENNITAETDGTITKVFVEPGKSVMQGDKLFDIQGTASAAAPAPAPVARPTAAPVAAPAPAAAAGPGKPMKSPLPGSILSIKVTEGQAVKRGETLLIMESMKMENEIKAEKDCVVTAIKVTQGQNVMQDDDLFLLA